MATKRIQAIESQAREAVENAQMWFDELESAELSISFEPTPAPKVNVTAQKVSIVLPTDTIGRVDRLMERTIYQACGLHVWRRDSENSDYWAALERVHEPTVAAVLATGCAELDEFGPRVVLYEAQAMQGCLEVFTPAEDIIELDRVANLVAMRFCEFEGEFGETANSEPTDAYLAIYAERVLDAFGRYVRFRTTVSTPLQATGTSKEALGATIGLEALSEHDDFKFMKNLWDNDPGTGAPAQNLREVDLDEIVWPPPPVERDEAEQSEVEDDQDAEEPEVWSWQDLDGVILSENTSLSEAAEEVGELFSLEEVPDDHRSAWDEEMLPGELGISSAMTSFMVLKCFNEAWDYGPRDGYPHVVFWCPPQYIALLLRCATEADVGLENALDGMLEVYTATSDVRGLIRFAERVRAMASEFDAISKSLSR